MDNFEDVTSADVSQEAIDAAWGDESYGGSETEEAESSGSDQGEGEPAESNKQQEGAAPAPEQEKTEQDKPDEGGQSGEGDQTETAPAEPEQFVLKNRDETRSVSRDEVIAMAQKGWDYDTVRQERDQLREYRDNADPALTIVRAFAEKSGMTVEQYVDFARKQELLSQGVNEQTADAQISVEKQQAAMKAQQEAQAAEEKRQADETAKQAQAQQAEAKAAEARQNDMRRFLARYPDVKPESIPNEVWKTVSEGESLTAAYTLYRNKQLEADLSAERKNRENTQKSIGSQQSAGAETTDDLISKYWNENE